MDISVEELLGLLDELTDDDTCRYDHHGYCQTHYLHDAPCPVSRAQKLLKETGRR